MAEDINKQIRRWEHRLKSYSNKEVPRAASSAINRVTKKVRTQVVRSVAKSEKLPNKVVKRKTFIRRSTAKTQKAVFTAYTTDVSVASLVRPATLAKKAGKGTSRRGVRAAGRTFEGAFINTGRRGNLLVYRRKGRSRYPIEVQKISIRNAVRSAVEPISQRLMRTDFRRLYERDLRFRLGKFEGRQ